MKSAKAAALKVAVVLGSAQARPLEIALLKLIIAAFGVKTGIELSQGK